MTTTVEAVFQGGVFKPTRPVDLPENQRVTLNVDAVPITGPDEMLPRSAKERIEEIIALPIESTQADPDTSRDHDHYLYGAPRRS